MILSLFPYEGESRTPCSSPLPDRRAMIKVNERGNIITTPTLTLINYR